MLFLRERTDVFSSELALLHVAPEYALQRRLRHQSNLRYLSVDLTSPLAMDHADLLGLPYADQRFDVVMCNHVLEHVDDDLRALREIRRVLKPGGRAIITSPVDQNLAKTLEDAQVRTPAERARAYGQRDHVRRYGRDFEQRVADEGFEVATIRYLEQLDPCSVSRMGLRRNCELFARDDVFICVRPAD